MDPTEHAKKVPLISKESQISKPNAKSTALISKKITKNKVRVTNRKKVSLSIKVLVKL